MVAVIWTPDHQSLSVHNQISLKIYITTWELTTHSKGVNGAEARGCDKAPPRRRAASLIHSAQASYLPTRTENVCGRNCQELATTTHTPTITPSTGHLGIESYSQIAWSQPPDSCWAVTLVEGTDGTAPSTWKVCRTPTDARTPLASPRQPQNICKHAEIPKATKCTAFQCGAGRITKPSIIEEEGVHVLAACSWSMIQLATLTPLI